jgi:hypothetical protein
MSKFIGSNRTVPDSGRKPLTDDHLKTRWVHLISTNEASETRTVMAWLTTCSQPIHAAYACGHADFPTRPADYQGRVGNFDVEGADDTMRMTKPRQQFR